ncbi:conserved hypothetical protein [Nitrobacter winogradskyi Nb-255]|uniref:Uncharacterized protein n=1 Tax=Nitrobacter winogradskyi (strain ATCC 25391 / DSM 10237 / CIP 104748 / NCIMB 11846 / Nb-255) TaxID=323098 RepID=Q3SW39_NITWN|nr:hypothetical protein [Nitrobacter winogradskyi]ABA03502.1 conserved hypothetical protein [Nitrobacter winogradskyi Nb-255]
MLDVADTAEGEPGAAGRFRCFPWGGLFLSRFSSLMTMVAVCCTVAAFPVQSQSLGDRFKGMFGIRSQPEQTAPAPGDTASVPDYLTCPSVAIRSGASTYAVGESGKPATGAEVRYQATIRDTARECDYNSDTQQISVKVGIRGRVIVGPAGAPPTVEVPLRVAVVEDGISPKTIATNAYTITVSLSDSGGGIYSFVSDDLSYPAPQGAAADRYVFYVGFDPQALKPEPRMNRRRQR